MSDVQKAAESDALRNYRIANARLTARLQATEKALRKYEAAASAAGQRVIETEYEVWELDEHGDVVCNCASSGDLREIGHYAAVYQQDHPIKICRLDREWLTPEQFEQAYASAQQQEDN